MGHRARLILFLGLIAGLALASLNAIIILQYGRRADALLEGAFLTGIGFALAFVWLGWQRTREQAGRQFDAQVVETFLRLLDQGSR